MSKQNDLGTAEVNLNAVLISDSFGASPAWDANDWEAIIRANSPDSIRQAINRILHRAVDLKFLKDPADAEDLVAASERYISARFAA